MRHRRDYGSDSVPIHHQFLAADDDTSPDPEPDRETTERRYRLVVSNNRNLNTVFGLEPSQCTLEDSPIPQASSVRLRHVLTSTWVRSTDIPIDKDEQNPVMTKVACSQTKRDEDTFAIILASASEVRDVDLVNSATKVSRNLPE